MFDIFFDKITKPIIKHLLFVIFFGARQRQFSFDIFQKSIYISSSEIQQYLILISHKMKELRMTPELGPEIEGYQDDHFQDVVLQGAEAEVDDPEFAPDLSA